MGRVRFAPCPEPGCPELAETCDTHRRIPWAGRTGSTRNAALGVTSVQWARLCRAALRRDHHRCRRCSAGAEVVDHLVPVAWRRPPRPFGAHLDQLGALCGPCHAIKTQREAAIGRQGRPDEAAIAAHVAWWIAECSGGTHAVRPRT